ncbi:MAG: TonB-dependent receptor, partial [Akkermansiaceae bacterium]
RELVLSFMTDWVQANDRTNNTPLPRIPPFRFGTRLAYTSGPLQAGLEIRHAFEQDHIQPSTNTVQGELSTDGYTEINLDVSYDFDLTPDLKLTVFASLSNLLDEERRLHTSFLKDVAPLPGRNFTLGGRLEF